MKKLNKDSKNKIFVFIAVFITTMINSFLSGKIIKIDHGTRQGGIAGAIETFVILIISLVIILVLHLLFNRNNKKSEKIKKGIRSDDIESL